MDMTPEEKFAERDDPDREAWAHDLEAATLYRLADLIRARTPAVESVPGEEIAF